MGISKIILPIADAETVKSDTTQIVGVKNISDAIMEMFKD